MSISSRFPFAPVLTLAVATGLAAAIQAATPGGGTVSGSNPEIAWTGETKVATASAECNGPADPTCDNYSLSVIDPGYPFQVSVTLDPTAAGDWDLQLYDANGSLVASSGNSTGSPEMVTINTAGTYTVSAAPFAPNPLQPYTAVAKLSEVDATPPPPPSSEPGMAFRTYAPPGLTELDPDYTRFAPTRGESGLGASAGEPTLGIPWVNNLALQQEIDPNLSRIMYLANLQTLRLEVDTSTSPAVGTWVNKSCASHVATLDPILNVDPITGRTISTQLNAKRSLMCLSGDDGDQWLDSPQGAGINAGVDHQTMGAGPYPVADTLRQPDPLNPTLMYEHATYYASQDIALAQAALSRDGGFTWGAAVPMYNITQCGGLHGHAQVGPDGAVYVPNGNCPLGQAGFARSLDAGLTWTTHGVPGSVPADDPGMGIGRGDKVSGGRVFFGACLNGKATAASSDDHGDNWGALTDVGAAHGIVNCAFATVVAGDDDRAAFAFLGTTTPGGAAYGFDPNQFDGVWHLYVAVTYDGGRSWVTSNATPNDPVQRGPICMQGTTCEAYRNLLDFNDISIDEKGRVYVGYSDGCVGNCIQTGPNSLTDYARIARQEDGTKGLFAAFDQELAASTPVAPKAPFAEATRTNATRADLKWVAPFDGNSAITEYRVFRRRSSDTTWSGLVTLGATTRGYADTSVLSGSDYCYQVRAVNAVGVSQSDFEACAAAPVDLGSACVAPGLVLGDDRSGEATDGTSIGLKRLFGGEPFIGDPMACGVPSQQKVEFNANTGAKLLTGNAVLLIWQRQSGTVVSKIAIAQPDDRNMVSVRMVGVTPQCHFGHVTGSSLTAPLPSHGYDIGAAFAAADCVVRDDGSITVRVPTSVIDDGAVGPGYSFGGLEARSFGAQPVATATSPQPVLQTVAADFLVAANFALAGNDSCRPNFKPQAADDRIASDFRSPTTFNPLANDTTGGDCDSLQIVNASNGAFGVVTLSGNQLTYTPTKTNKCTDEFSYTISDGHGLTDDAVVVVRSTRPNCRNN